MPQELEMNIEFTFTKFVAAISFLASMMAWWSSYHKNVAEAALAAATIEIKAAQEGKTFLLLEPDGNCQKVEINFERGEFKFRSKEKLVGVRKPSGNVEAFGERCHITLLEAMR